MPTLAWTKTEKGVQFSSVEVIRVARSRKESVSTNVLALEEMNEEEDQELVEK